MCRSKVCFILRGHVSYVTRIFLWLLFILVGKMHPPMHARAFSLTSFETQSSSCDYIRVSGRLIYSPKCLLDLNNWKRFSFVRDCDGFLKCFVILGPARYFFVLLLLLLLLFIIIIIIIFFFFFCASERAVRGWGRKEGNAYRQTPRFWKPSTWTVMPEFTHRHLMLSSAVIIDQKNVCPSEGRKWT